MNQRVSPWRGYLQLTLLLGAAYDIAFGLGILFMPHRLAGVLGLPVPEDELYLRFISVFLIGLALTYLLPAVDPERFRPVIWIAVVVRALGFLFMASAVVFHGRPMTFLLLASGDLAFSAAHAAGLLGTRTTPDSFPKS
jgi:hypothetical protein